MAVAASAGIDPILKELTMMPRNLHPLRFVRGDDTPWTDVDRRARRLREALEGDELVLHFQPQFDRSARLSGAEALVRWDYPEEGLLPPAAFIPLAEQTGLITLLDHWVLQTACRQHREWSRTGLHLPRIAVNLSATSLRSRKLTSRVLEILRETGMDPTALELELTESMALTDFAQAAQTLQELRGLGIRIALDDYGSGHSSPGYLLHLPLDTLKIDRSFVQNLPANAKSALLTDTIITLAHNLELRVVAEGVETEAQRSWLLEKGCEYFQGFHLGRPMAADGFARLLHAQCHPTAIPCPGSAVRVV